MNESTDSNQINHTNESDIWELDNLPNRLTLFRLFLVPVVAIPLYLQLTDIEFVKHNIRLLNYIAGWTFVAASITDFLDGHFARKRKLVTVFGSFLDPIADKFLVVSSLIMLLALERIDSALVIILILREMYITSLRLLASDHKVSIPVGNLGKWKTALQMIAIPMLMGNDTWFGVLNLAKIGEVFIYLAAAFSLLSALRYTLKLIQKLRDSR